MSGDEAGTGAGPRRHPRGTDPGYDLDAPFDTDAARRTHDGPAGRAPGAAGWSGDDGWDPGSWDGEIPDDVAWHEDETDDLHTGGPATGGPGTGDIGTGDVVAPHLGTGGRRARPAHGGGGAHGSRRRVHHERRRHPVLTTIAVLVAVVALLALGIGIHLDHEITPGGHPGAAVEVTIPEGASTAQIGAALARAGVIKGPSLFRYYVAIRHDGPLLAGTYRLDSHESYSAVIAVLEKGPPVVVEHLVIPEGFTLQQIAARVQAMPGLGLSAEKFLAASRTGAVRSPYEPAGVDNLEGLVFPATYDVTRGMDEADILQEMVTAFVERATALDLTGRAAALKMTPYDVVTVASIVEREAKLDADRGGVASAIYNRLRAGIPLGADSTLVYALRQSDPGVDVAKINYNQPNPYNTRLHAGLPPTPIANPGLPSLTAAVDPPATTYLYFVEINPDGKLGFASTTSGFEQLTDECRAAGLC